MTLFHLVQHADKQREPGDPGLTDLGRRQAARTAEWARTAGLRTLFSSPLRRARDTAAFLSDATGLPVHEDARLRERMNWDGSQPLAAFLADWTTTVGDRTFVPASGDSSHSAADRLRACLLDLSAHHPGPLALVTHGGITTDLLRTLLGDAALPPGLLHHGVPSCAITTLDSRLTVLSLPSTSHLV